jgi:hypothetical protein
MFTTVCILQPLEFRNPPERLIRSCGWKQVEPDMYTYLYQKGSDRPELVSMKTVVSEHHLYEIAVEWIDIKTGLAVMSIDFGQSILRDSWIESVVFIGSH